MSKGETDTNGVSKNWELNQYELNRIPHEIIYDETEIAISPQILQNELLCPICLDILKKTMTTKECLHRFCHDCIITALRSGNKECPTCRKKLISKRSLRPDPNFDGIIAKIYPNRAEYDAMHERVLEKLKYKKVLNTISHKSLARQNKLAHKNLDATSSNNLDTDELATNGNNDEAAMDFENSNSNENQKLSNAKVAETNKGSNKRAVFERNNAHNQQNSDDSDIESRTSTEQSSSLHMANDSEEIELVLKPHPFKEFNPNSHRFLKTTSNAFVSHLSKYLWTRCRLETNPGASTLSQASSPSSSSSKSSTNQPNGTHASNSTNAPASSSSATTANSDNQINDFQIFYSSNESKVNCFHSLNPNLTLEQVVDKYWKQNRPLELFYFNHKSNGHSSTNLKNDEHSNTNSNTNSNASNNTNNNPNSNANNIETASSISSKSSSSSSSTASGNNSNGNGNT